MLWQGPFCCSALQPLPLAVTATDQVGLVFAASVASEAMEHERPYQIQHEVSLRRQNPRPNQVRGLPGAFTLDPVPVSGPKLLDSEMWNACIVLARGAARTHMLRQLPCPLALAAEACMGQICRQSIGGGVIAAQSKHKYTCRGMFAGVAKLRNLRAEYLSRKKVTFSNMVGLHKPTRSKVTYSATKDDEPKHVVRVAADKI